MTGTTLIVHGGAGRVRKAREQICIDGCRKAARAGWQVLETGGTALDAVVAAVQALEDDPAFNAGTGAVLRSDGSVELDASIMDGASLEAGAVGALRRVRNPIALAREVMEDSRHVLLVGPGAERFAVDRGMVLSDPAEFITQRQRRRWEKGSLEKEGGTVGCVALDTQGRLAAGTSTGGTFNALPGRVGDSAQIGCGTYANGAGGASCTGIGEAIIRTVLAKTVLDWLAAGEAVQIAARRAVEWLEKVTGAEVGLIAIDTSGNIGYAHNSPHMPVCWIRGDGEMHVDV